MKIYGYKGMCNLCGPRIREAREQKRITQDQLSAKMQVEGIQVNQKAISRIETGDRVVTDYELKAFSKVLNVSLIWLLAEGD